MKEYRWLRRDALTTKALVSELPEEKKAPAGGGHGGGMEGMY